MSPEKQSGREGMKNQPLCNSKVDVAVVVKKDSLGHRRIRRRGYLFTTRQVVFLFILPQIVMAKESGVMPRFTENKMANHTVRVGSELSFACLVEDLGPYKVAWLHSEKGTLAVYPHVITQNNRISLSHDNRDSYSLQLRDITESDAGKYICQINTDPVISISGGLSVIVPPEIIDKDSSSDTLVTEGMRISLVCRARGIPRVGIAWRREDGKHMAICDGKPSSKRRKQNRRTGLDNDGCKKVHAHYGEELVLHSVRRSDSGVYLCIASNGVPPTISKRVRLHVNFPPTLWISHQLVGASVGGTAELECLTSANPESINMWQNSDLNYITQERGKYVVEESKGPMFYNSLMKLRIVNITERDFGKYRCIAKNPQGETTSEIELYELPKPTTTTPLWPPSETDFPAVNQTSVVLLNEDVEGRKKDRKHRKHKKNKKKHHRKKMDEEQDDDDDNDDNDDLHRTGSDFEKRYGPNVLSNCQSVQGTSLLIILITSFMFIIRACIYTT